MDTTELELTDAWWRAANYLAAQIHLLAIALLSEPLRAEQIKPRLHGHWARPPA